MARTTFSGPVKSDNGFEGDIAGSAASFTVLRAASATFQNFTFTSSTVAELSATVLRSASATLTNLLCTSLTVGTMKVNQGVTTGSATSGQAGYIAVDIGGTVRYIALYTSATP